MWNSSTTLLRWLASKLQNYGLRVGCGGRLHSLDTMRARDALVVALLSCGGDVPTSTSFLFSPPSWTAASATTSRGYHTNSSYPCQRTASTRPGLCCGRHHARLRSRRPHSRAFDEEAVQHYADGDLERLSRSELQALCKELGVRAVGKTSELLTRLQHHHQHQEHAQQQSLAEASFPSSSSFPIDDHAPATTLVGDSSRAGPTTTTLDDVLSTPDRRSSATTTTSADLESTPTTTTTTAAAMSASSPLSLDGEALMDRPLVAGGEDDENAEAIIPDFLLDGMRPAFEELSDDQWEQVGMLGELLTEWNGRVNLISRKDIANVLPRHVIPCLAMAKALNLQDGVDVLDVGTGGGLPGLPLAIFYPKVQFTLVDGTGKKIKAVQDMALRLGLDNVRAFHVRAEEVHESFDFVMGRAVTALPKFVGFIDKNLKRNPPSSSPAAQAEAGAASDTGSTRGSSDGGGRSGDREKGIHLKRGLLYMRGEVTAEELAELGAQPSTVIPLQRDFVRGPGGEEGPEGREVGARDRGYSSVFHFTSEAIWNRMPVAASSSAREQE